MSDVLRGLERTGYQRAADCADGKVRYLFPDGEATVERYVILEPKPTARIYAVYFGFSSGELWRVRNQLANCVAAELGRRVNKLSPCWTTFDVGQALKWPLLGAPYPREQSVATAQFAAMSQYLQSVLTPVRGPRAVLDRLLSFEAPFSWISLNHPVRRAVEAFAAAKVTGQQPSAIKEPLLAAQRYLYRSLRIESRWPDLIDTLCTHAAHSD